LQTPWWVLVFRRPVGGDVSNQNIQRRLYQPIDLPALLQLNQQEIDWLIKTAQLNPMRIAGEIRFDSRQVDALIDTYLQVAKRKGNYVQ
jgi:hypothetical protein